MCVEEELFLCHLTSFPARVVAREAPDVLLSMNLREKGSRERKQQENSHSQTFLARLKEHKALV